MEGPETATSRALLYAQLMWERFGDPGRDMYVRCPDRPADTGDGPTAEFLHAQAAAERLAILAKEIDEDPEREAHRRAIAAA